MVNPVVPVKKLYAIASVAPNCKTGKTLIIKSAGPATLGRYCFGFYTRLMNPLYVIVIIRDRLLMYCYAQRFMVFPFALIGSLANFL